MVPRYQTVGSRRAQLLLVWILDGMPDDGRRGHDSGSLHRLYECGAFMVFNQLYRWCGVKGQHACVMERQHSVLKPLIVL